jgi:hypothetical protein
MNDENDIYLGDGVYASFDGFQIILDLRAQGSDQICLDPSVLTNLFKYARKLGWEPPK